MPATAPTETPTPHPVSLIRAAIKWCRAKGIPVRPASNGWSVHCVSQQRPKWAMYPRASGVDPISAALLHYQPEAEDPYEAAVECLFAPLSWVLAFEAGLKREEMPDAWLSAADHRLRVAGYEAGLRYRDELFRPTRVA